ncbi:MAG: hypothetical protein EZS26_001957 [Candidatus Ordinivivax streblomastigis]|uniref:WG repeat-containing protein n=1 Tax=Candidatus Ordinivivax streblomastigis TaxID=2540710 RepID=A0A5M8P0M7_9BACT|nr:MAG: hypothetical protein EZS26_001957 [Candidatus Ordinivivax streblomastigis]
MRKTSNIQRWSGYGISWSNKFISKYDNYVDNPAKHFAEVELNGKWGFIDKTGKEVIPCKYDQIHISFSTGYACVVLNGKGGFINSVGEEVIPCIYDGIGTIRDNEAVELLLDGKWQLVDFAGNVLAAKKNNDKSDSIDTTEEEIVPSKYDSIIPCYNEFAGLSRVELNNKWGLIDSQTGKEIVSLLYNKIEVWGDYALVESENEYGFIDKTGKMLMPLRPINYNNIQRDAYGEGVIAMKVGYKWGFIDNAGNEITPFKYDAVPYYFCSGFAPVRISHKWGFIDRSGKEVIPVKYEEIDYFFRDCLAKVKLNRKWGFIDETGTEVIPPQYKEVHDFHQGLAAVKLNGKWGFIDKTDKMVIPPKYNTAYHFFDVEGLNWSIN